MHKFPLFLILACICSFTSCTQVLYLTMGMKNPKMLTDKQLQHYSHKRKIPESHSFYADTLLLNYIVEQDKSKLQRKNHAQPLQALYFHKTDAYPVSWFLNCYANPTTFRLHWNKNGELDSLPPRGNAPLDSLLTQQKLLSFIKPVYLHAQPVPSENEYNVYVLYNRLFNRGSRHLIWEIRNHAQKYNGHVVIHYINTDRLYAGTDFGTEE